MSSTTREASDDACLKEQQRVIRSALKFDIHPTIRHALASREGTRRIADVSSGLEPLEPVDIPVSCEVVDVTDLLASDKLAPEHQGQFSAVAVRLLHLSLDTSAWDRAMRNLMVLLRPGGWIQWVDWDPLTARIAGVAPGCTDTILRNVFQRSRDVLRSQKVGTTYRIPAAFQTTGFEEVDSDLYPVTPDVPFTRAIASEAITTLSNNGSITAAEEQQLRLQVTEEVDASGSLLWYDLWCHIARKPENS